MVFALQIAALGLHGQNWQLKWADEFNESNIDLTNTWNVEVNGNGGGNAELQYYRSENLSAEKYQGYGCMVLTAQRANFGGKQFTSARVNTLGNIYFQYGKIESRIKIPETANGLWPAFWLMGNDFDGTNWPSCGEIDVMECGHNAGIASGTQSLYMGGALHWGPVSPAFIHYMDYTAQQGPYSIQDSFHLFTLIWNADSIKMFLDRDKYPNVRPYFEKRISSGSADNISGYFHKPFHLLYNLAVGGPGFTGISNPDLVTALPTSGSTKKFYIDYIRVYQKGEAGEKFYSRAELAKDTIKPTGIRASIGKITPNGVEIILDGTDNSGSIIYNIAYNGTTVSTEALSGQQKTLVVNGLISGETYNFTIRAKDASNNYADETIQLSATMAPGTSCEGVSNLASQGSFDIGYRYNFSTQGNNVTVTFELLDQKTGLVAYLWDQTLGFVETPMSPVASGKFTLTLAGKTAGTNLKLACKFAYPGGMSVTKQFVYTVGTNCPASGIESFGANNVQVFPNPAADKIVIHASRKILDVKLKNLLGQTVKFMRVNGLNTEMALNDVAVGTCILIINMENGTQSVQKIAKR